ncbi:MBL fold metallo-hydrolase [Amycolatopsis mongoliensis]|uniref:MBL fold metallo-hydrolase n=1 Tax=Amycolatopsis mongoliensis TaxID=715475 RepID=A0A9Y2K1B5_9PSEU|nr:MBL fold metallo-hydrolase [Amycolatopsis sp. 4-36]WIY07446.1 MBL fold metallo-hydrolase [Amycolatopsis sp. 4-36]
MTGGKSIGATAGLREIASNVFWLGLPGRTRTNVYFIRSGPAWVLVDAGWAKDARRIENTAKALFGATTGPPAAILLTHVHPDHAGSARYLARLWDCAVHLHPDELPIANADFETMVAVAGPLDRWVVLPLLRAMGRRRRQAALERSTLGALARPVEPGHGLPGLPDWECVSTPGHTPGHLAYFRPADRVLLSGDALVTLRIRTVRGLLTARPGLSAPPWYTTWDPTLAAESIRRLAALSPTVLAGGHGTPLTGPGSEAALSAFVSGRQHSSDR